MLFDTDLLVARLLCHVPVAWSANAFSPYMSVRHALEDTVRTAHAFLNAFWSVSARVEAVDSLCRSVLLPHFCARESTHCVLRVASDVRQSATLV